MGFGIVFLAIFGGRIDYGADVDGREALKISGSSRQNTQEEAYHYFKDVNVMMVVGFGFLVTFLRRYGYSVLSYNILLVAFVIQWALIMKGSTKVSNFRIRINVTDLIEALYATCAVLISFGAVAGKLSPLQYLIMALCEVPVLAWNEYLGRSVLYAVDAGDSIFIHGFGAYFGLGVALVLKRGSVYKNPKESSTYHSDLFSMIGCLFLWIYWPSFNSAVLAGNSQPRAVVNTVLSLSGATIMAFIMAAVLPPLESTPPSGAHQIADHGKHSFRSGKFFMVYVQNCILAGGVIIGTSCNMMIRPVIAILMGSFAGFFSVIGFRFVTKYMNKYWHDTCGVHNVHGFPSFLAVIISACAASIADKAKYADELLYVFPALSAAVNQHFVLPTQTYTTTLDLSRSPVTQGGFQMAAWCHTFIISLAAGVLTGLVLRFALFFETPEAEALFDDLGYFWTADRCDAHESGRVVPSVGLAMNERPIGGYQTTTKPDPNYSVYNYNDTDLPRTYVERDNMSPREPIDRLRPSVVQMRNDADYHYGVDARTNDAYEQ